MTPQTSIIIWTLKRLLPPFSSYQSSGTMALLEWRYMLNVRPTRILVYSQQCWSVTGLSLRHHAHGPPSLLLLNVWRIWHTKKHFSRQMSVFNVLILQAINTKHSERVYLRDEWKLLIFFKPRVYLSWRHISEKRGRKPQYL